MSPTSYLSQIIKANSEVRDVIEHLTITKEEIAKCEASKDKIIDSVIGGESAIGLQESLIYLLEGDIQFALKDPEYIDAVCFLEEHKQHSPTARKNLKKLYSLVPQERVRYAGKSTVPTFSLRDIMGGAY